MFDETPKFDLLRFCLEASELFRELELIEV